jgi:hypothetical protein
VATAFFGGAFFGGEFFSTSTAADSADVGGGGKPWKQKWRQELVELLDKEEPKPVPRRVKRAIQRVIEQAPQDDTGAKQALRSELESLNVNWQADYFNALRWEIAKHYQQQMEREARYRQFLDDDDEDVILLLH